MNKYKNDLFLYDDGLENKVIELLQTECYQPKDAKILLDTILELRLDDISMQSTVDECFTAIRNLAGIPMSLMHLGSPDENSWREYAIKFFSKAIDVLDSDLQTSVDYDERHQDTYILEESFLNASEANYAYAKSIIESELVQCFDVSDKSDEVVTLFKNVVTPVYSHIKRILIDVLEGDDYVDDVEFNTPEEAQAYLGNIKDNKKLKFEITLILIDEYELFDEIELPLYQECEDEYWKNSIPTMVQEYIESPYLNDFSHKVDMNKYQD